MPTPGVTIYRSDGACRGQGTIAETLAGWGAAVWSADARGLGAGVAFATARGFLGNDYSNNQAEYFALLQCLFRALRLQDPHVIFEVDSLILAKQLARHLPWACRSENLIALHQQCVHVCDSLPLFTSRGFVIFIVNSTRPQIRYLIRQSTSVTRMVFSILVVFSLRIMFNCHGSWVGSVTAIVPTLSQSVGISPVPQSPMQASPMNVEHALGAPILRISRTRPSASAVMDQTVVAL